MPQLRRTPRVHRGFTLMEVMVIVVILIGVTIVMVPLFANSRERGRQTACLNNQKQIAAMILLYAQDHEGLLPTSPTVWDTLRAQRLPKDLFVCPTVRKLNLTTLENDYVYNDAINGQELGQIRLPSSTMLTADGLSAGGDNICRTQLDLLERHNNRLNASFVDGHMEWIPAEGLLTYH